MSKHLKRILALLLSVILVLSLFPAAFAAEAKTVSDKDEQEYTQHGLGLLPTLLRGSTKPSDGSASVQGNTAIQTEDLPEHYDSRDYGYITPVKNQGDYNTCWAFGTAASCEAYMIKHGVHVGETGQVADQNLNLSEYHLAYYTYTDAYDAEGMLTGDKTYFLSSHPNGTFLEAGGTGELVSYPLMRWSGLADESVDALKYSAANTAGLGGEHAYQDNVAHVTSAKHFFGSNVDEVKRHIMEYGAGAMGVRVSNASGTAYHGGVNTTNGTICWIQSAVAYQDPGFYYADHDVTVVGWDDTYSKDNFNQGYRPNNDGAWIVKNSWGTDIGKDGYFYVSYEDSATCASYISFFTVEDVDNYDHNYQYDGSGNYYNSEEMVTGDSIAQVFTANGNETLEAVALALYGDNTDYTVKVYTGCAVDDPTSGTLAATKTGNFDYWGYRTIKLDSPVTLSPGQRFAIVISFSGNDINVAYDTTVQEDQYYHMGLIHMTHPNTSYFKGVSDSSWTNKSGDGNYRVKAFTKDIPEDPVPVTLSCVALGSVYNTISGTAGDKIQLPTTAPAADGWTFQGWVTVPTPETAVKPTFYKPGATFKLTSSVLAVYALYMRAEAIDAPVTYELVSTMPDTWVGKYVFTCMNLSGTTEYAMYGVEGGTNVENANSAVVFADSGITRNGTTLSNVPEQYVFEAESTSYGMSIRSQSTGSYLAATHTGSSNTAYTLYALAEFDAESCGWVFELDDGDGYLKNSNSGLIPYLAVSGGSTFSLTRYGGEFKFYKQNPTENYYYSTEIAGGAHAHNLSYTAAKAPTCGAAGNIEYWFCALCGKYFSDADAQNEITQADTVIAATGEHQLGEACISNNNGTHYHTCNLCGKNITENCTYTDTVVSPTETEQGYTEHTCTACGYSFRDNYTAPLSGGYTVSFTVPSGVEPVANMVCAIGEAIILPTAGAPEGYTFLGWVTEDYNNVAEQPGSILAGSYAATANITLKALYSYTESSGGISYQLVTENASDWTGNYVITKGKTPEFVMAGLDSDKSYETEANGGAVVFASSGITLEGNELKNVSNLYSFAVAPVTGNYYSFQNAEKESYLISKYTTLYAGAFSESSSRWSITIGSDGVATIKNPSTSYSNVISFSTSSTWGNVFQVYGSASDIYLWKEVASGTTYYTTIIGEPAHEHTPGEAVKENEVPATCEEAGHYDMVVYCTVCHEEISRETVEIPALGHDWDAPTYEWAADNSTVTATRVCKNDPAHVETETVNTTYEVVTEPTLEAEGLGRYTAVFANEAFETQTKDVVLPKLEPTGYHIYVTNKTRTPALATTSLNEETLYSGAVTFTVTCNKACVVAIDNGDGTYTKLDCTATESGEHSFAVTVTNADVTIVVALRGDVNLDGKVTTADATMVKQAYLGTAFAIDPNLQTLTADANRDGRISTVDATFIKQAYLGSYTIQW